MLCAERKHWNASKANLFQLFAGLIKRLLNQEKFFTWIASLFSCPATPGLKCLYQLGFFIAKHLPVIYGKKLMFITKELLQLKAK